MQFLKSNTHLLLLFVILPEFGTEISTGSVLQSIVELVCE